MASDAAIAIEGVRHQYQPPAGKPVLALDNISLDIRPQEFVALLGPSGCGKSTLLYLIGGFLPVQTGAIRVGGRPVPGPGPDRGIVFQHFALFPWKTVRGNVEYGLVERGMPRAERGQVAQRFIDMVGLSGFENSYPNRLSGGMQQRVAIARMLACEPSILLMDEPFGALDAQTRKIMQEELRALWRRFGKTVVFVTHDVREAVFLSQRVVVMSTRPGRIKAIVETGLGPDASREAIDEKADQLWEMLRDEVVRAMAEERRKA
jgi:NitT/TauT family transport system ATP-binding protein